MSKDFGLDRAKPGKVGLNGDALVRLGDVLKREIGEGRLPGAVTMIARKGVLAYASGVSRSSDWRIFVTSLQGLFDFQSVERTFR